MWPLAVSVSFVVGLALASVLWKQDMRKHNRPGLPGADEGTHFPYQKGEAMLTENELALFKALVWVAGEESYLFAKVRLLDLVSIPKHVERPDFYRNLARTRRVDFVLCDRVKARPACVIQLADVSRRKKEEDDGDDVVDRALNAAGIPVLRVTPSPSYAANELKAQIRNTMNRRSEALALQA